MAMLRKIGTNQLSEYYQYSREQELHSRLISFLNQRDIFQHVPITSRKPVMPDSKGVPGFFAFWGSSRILANPGVS